MANSVKKLLPFLALMLCAMLLPADEPTFSQRIEWRANANALEYKVEIQNTATSVVSSFTTEKTFAELSLAPGNYRYRVTVYDFLGRKATTSAWTAFSVIQAAEPEIRRIERNVTAPDAGGRLEIAVDIANVSADSQVELVSENVPGELGISGSGGKDEKERVSKVYFQDVPPGKWRLRVTNASGFSAESDVIEVVKVAPAPPPPVVEQDDAEATAREAAERAAREAAELAERLAREEQEAAEREAREAAARLAAEKEKKPPKPPYVFKDITVSGGAGLAFMPYDGTVKDMTGNAAALAFVGRIAAFPIKREKQRFGFELCGLYADLGTKTDFYTVNLTFLQLGVHVVWKHTLFGPKSFFALKGGGGVVAVDYATTYSRNDEDRRKPSERRLLFYPAATAGASLIFNPAQFLSFEVGADFLHLFITGMPTGCVTPYVCVGFRL